MTVPPLDEVAHVYAEALKQGRPPKLAVSRHYQRPIPTAGRWIMKARQAGLIDPPRPKVNELHVAVGQQLNVEPSTLALALKAAGAYLHRLP